MQKTTLMVLAIFLTACTHNVPKKQVYTSKHPPIEKGSENFKYCPFRSAILEYKAPIKGALIRTKIWDNWGAISYSKRYNKINYVYYGTSITIDNLYKNNIIKDRNYLLDMFIANNEDLSAYYFPVEFTPNMKKTIKKDIVIGKSCTIWSDNVRRMCLYKDKIPLKFESYKYKVGESTGKWYLDEIAVRAEFNVPVDMKSYNLPKLTKKDYSNNQKTHKYFRNTKDGQRNMKSFIEHQKRVYKRIVKQN